MAIAEPLPRQFESGEPRLFTQEEFRTLHRHGVIRPDENLALRHGLIVDADSGSPRLWDRDEYYGMLEAGLFDEDKKVELLEGELVHKMSQNMPHIVASHRTRKLLEKLLDPALEVVVFAPIQAGRRSEPEPDTMVVPGPIEDYADNPTTQDALLVVEISDTSQSIDRGRKSRIYAQAGVQDYWILIVPSRTLEIRRGPAERPDGTYGYLSITSRREDQTVSPLAAPDARIRVADLLPPLKKEE